MSSVGTQLSTQGTTLADLAEYLASSQRLSLVEAKAELARIIAEHRKQLGADAEAKRRRGDLDGKRAKAIAAAAQVLRRLIEAEGADSAIDVIAEGVARLRGGPTADAVEEIRALSQLLGGIVDGTDLAVQLWPRDCGGRPRRNADVWLTWAAYCLFERAWPATATATATAGGEFYKFVERVFAASSSKPQSVSHVVKRVIRGVRDLATLFAA